MAEEFREAILRLYPTEVRLPAWARPLSIKASLPTLTLTDLDVKLVNEAFTLKGLMRSPYRPDLKPVLDPSEIVEDIRAIAPVDGTEVVEWMQLAAAEYTVMQARIAEYNALGSQLVGGSNDAYIPGLVVEDVMMESVSGAVVSSRGYVTVYTPAGNYTCPNLGKSTGIFSNHLSWASIVWTRVVQFLANLLKWKSLASTPIKQTVGFFMDGAGHVAPNFFVMQTSRPMVRARTKLVFESNNEQTVTLNFRDPTNYKNVLLTKSFKIPAGTSTVLFTITAIPYIPPLVTEIQPQDNVQTKLNEFVVGKVV